MIKKPEPAADSVFLGTCKAKCYAVSFSKGITHPLQGIRCNVKLLNATDSPDQDATFMIKKAHASCRHNLSWGHPVKPNVMLCHYLTAPLIEPFETELRYSEILKILKLLFPNTKFNSRVLKFTFGVSKLFLFLSLTGNRWV